MRKRLRTTSLYTYLLVLLLSILLPVQFIGSFILLSSVQHVQQNVVEKSQQALVNTMEQLNFQIETIYQRAQSYLMDSSSSSRQVFTVEAVTEPGKRWIHLRTIANELLWISRYNDLILESRLYYPTLGFSISDYSYAELSATEAAGLNGRELLRAEGDKLILATSYPAGRTSTIEDILILHQVTLSLPRLHSMLEERVFAGTCLLYLNGECVWGPEDATSYFAQNPLAHNARITLSGQTWHTFVHTDRQYGFTLVNLVPVDVLDANSRSLYLLLAAYAVLSVLVIIACVWGLSRSVHRPIRRLLRGFDQMRDGQLEVQIKTSGPGEFHQLTEGFNRMVRSLNEAIQTIYDQKVYMQQIELKQLQSQINPHFLYNTFFMLERLIDDEDIQTSQATCRYLGNYFRYITYTGVQQAKMADEYGHAMNYLELQKLRYEDNLAVEADALPDSIADCIVPRLIFQPILENVFKHGLNGSGTYMHMRIHIWEGKDIRFVFENSASQSPQRALELDLDSPRPENETTGMINIHRRIRLLYGEPYGLQLSQSELGGLMVTVLLPARRNEPNGNG